MGFGVKEVLAFGVAAVGLAACRDKTNIPISPTLTVTPDGKSIHAPVNPTTIPVLPSPTDTLRPPATSASVPTLLDKRRANIVIVVGTSSVDNAKNETLTESGCQKIFYPDGFCLVMGFRDKDMNYLTEQFERGNIRVSATLEKPRFVLLYFGVNKTVVYTEDTAKVMEVRERLIKTIRSDPYYEEVLIAEILPVPTNTDDPEMKKIIDQRQTRYYQAVSVTNDGVLLVDPKQIVLRYRDKFDLSHPTAESNAELLKLAKSEVDKRLQPPGLPLR